VYANPTCPAGCPCDLPGLLHGSHRVAVRLVMILLSCQRWPSAAIAELLGYDPSTVRRWIHRDNTTGSLGSKTARAAAGRGWAAHGSPGGSGPRSRRGWPTPRR